MLACQPNPSSAPCSVPAGSVRDLQPGCCVPPTAIQGLAEKRRRATGFAELELPSLTQLDELPPSGEEDAPPTLAGSAADGRQACCGQEGAAVAVPLLAGGRPAPLPQVGVQLTAAPVARAAVVVEEAAAALQRTVCPSASYPVRRVWVSRLWAPGTRSSTYGKEARPWSVRSQNREIPSTLRRARFEHGGAQLSSGQPPSRAAGLARLTRLAARLAARHARPVRPQEKCGEERGEQHKSS